MSLLAVEMLVFEGDCYCLMVKCWSLTFNVNRQHFALTLEFNQLLTSLQHIDTDLLHCPCHLRRGFPWRRHSQPPSSQAGTHSAIRSDPEYSGHCCYTDLGIPLQKQTHMVLYTHTHTRAHIHAHTHTHSHTDSRGLRGVCGGVKELRHIYMCILMCTVNSVCLCVCKMCMNRTLNRYTFIHSVAK